MAGGRGRGRAPLGRRGEGVMDGCLELPWILFSGSSSIGEQLELPRTVGAFREIRTDFCRRDLLRCTPPFLSFSAEMGGICRLAICESQLNSF